MYIICDWIYGNRSKSQIGGYEIINFKDFKAPRIVSEQGSIRDVYIRWVVGDGMAGKVYI